MLERIICVTITSQLLHIDLILLNRLSYLLVQLTKYILKDQSQLQEMLSYRVARVADSRTLMEALYQTHHDIN